jgi:hypothetical protein
MAVKHLVFKRVLLDPDIKFSEIVASINVTKVTAAVITVMIISLRDTLPKFYLEIRIASSDAAGCNWVSFGDALSTHTFCGALFQQILDEYPIID